ncbi:DNA alkylation repair protein [Candidatus Berkelbacteria bacterium]|nr:DNA alkylation repair protein [Candidatus Berkelbacteria bacterium]
MKLKTDQDAVAVRRALALHASPERAKSSAWFFKTGPGQYGEGDRFIGVTVPEQRRVASQYRTLPLSQIEQLLNSPVHEHRLTALFILVYQYQRAVKLNLEIETGTIVACYVVHRARVNNWDLVDSSAPFLLGAWLLNHDRSLLTTLARSTNLWDRRIAIVATHAFIRVGQFEDTLRLASILLGDQHDLIHKAVGWMLREVGKRDEAVLRQFLNEHVAHMPRTMLRYALEKLPALDRHRYLSR